MAVFRREFIATHNIELSFLGRKKEERPLGRYLGESVTVSLPVETRQRNHNA